MLMNIYSYYDSYLEEHYLMRDLLTNSWIQEKYKFCSLASCTLSFFKISNKSSKNLSIKQSQVLSHEKKKKKICTNKSKNLEKFIFVQGNIFFFCGVTFLNHIFKEY